MRRNQNDDGDKNNGGDDPGQSTPRRCVFSDNVLPLLLVFGIGVLRCVWPCVGVRL